MLTQILVEQWRAKRALNRCLNTMIFESGALKLGAETVLGQASQPQNGEDPINQETRLLALLSAAYDRAISKRALTHVSRAIALNAEGEVTLASIHLALSGLGRLAEPTEDSRRLFMADGFMKAGISPL